MSSGEWSKKIVRWYRKHHRKLPWRETNDPYRIWLSEIILQQTRIDQGLPYYHQFIRTFPTLASLARANERSVLRLWQGLGYYSRARNMLKCARVVIRDHDGKFPANAAELMKLPGIGTYTAAAISSMAFGMPAAVVDGNVFRVLARFFGIATPINTTEGIKKFRAHAQGLIPVRNPGLHNQAMMELGALVCTPVAPSCNRCPVSVDCVARKSERQTRLPVKKPKPPVHRRYFYYFVFKHNGRIFMKRRVADDIWKGLYDFPLIEGYARSFTKTAVNKMSKELGIPLSDAPTVIGPYKNILSHQVIETRFLIFERPADAALSAAVRGHFYTLKKIADLPKPVLISRFLHDQRLF